MQASLNSNMMIAGCLRAPYRPHLFTKMEPVTLHLTRTALAEDEVFLILVFIYSEANRQERTVSTRIPSPCLIFWPYSFWNRTVPSVPAPKDGSITSDGTRQLPSPHRRQHIVLDHFSHFSLLAVVHYRTQSILIDSERGGLQDVVNG